MKSYFQAILAVICLLLFSSPNALAQPACEPPDGNYAVAWMAIGWENSDPSGCATATIPAGQKFIFFSYWVQYYDYVLAYDYVSHATVVKVNGTTVYSDTAPFTLATAHFCEDEGRNCYRGVGKTIDVSSFTQGGAAALEVTVSAELPPYGPGSGSIIFKSAGVSFKPRFLLSDTPSPFRPRNSESSDPAAATCNSGPDCYPIFEARLLNDCFDVKIGFELSEISALPGVSTNYGSGTDPDYIVDPDLNGGLSSTSAPAGTVAYLTDEFTRSAYLLVSSRDYGGTAKLRAYFLDPDTGTKYYAEVVTNIEEPGEALPRQFAKLPLDDDNDGMADGWETSHGGSLIPGADTDQAPNNGSTVGDGLTVIEEYRGFHYVDRSGGTPQVEWTSTNPMDVLDLFFWDYEGAFFDDLSFFRSQFPFIDLREVSGTTGMTLKNSPQTGYSEANKLNKNTTSPDSVYPLLLRNTSLGANCNPANGTTGGTMARAPGSPRLGDKGYGPDGRDIEIDSTVIDACASFYQFPANDWRQILIAHEIGHNLGLSHPIEYRAFSAVSYSTTFSLLQNLPLDKYTYDPSPNTEFFTWLKDYYYPLSGLPDIRQAERAVPGLGVLGSNPTLGSCGSYYADLSAPRRSIYCRSLENAIQATNVMVAEQSLLNGSQVNVMNWTPRLDSAYHSASAWSFSADDTAVGTCVRRCPQ